MNGLFLIELLNSAITMLPRFFKREFWKAFKEYIKGADE